MSPNDRPRFSALLGDVMAFYRQDMSKFATAVWWEACLPFDFEQVAKAMNAHAIDPDRGQYPPKPADIVRLLQGTHGDRALIAWGKTLEAMGRVGSYATVVFDDPVIHAVIDDLGGWVQVCRTKQDEMPFLQKRFCDAYKAYAKRGADLRYPAKLLGTTDLENAKSGYDLKAPPVLIGNAQAAAKVLQLGGAKLETTTLTDILKRTPLLGDET